MTAAQEAAKPVDIEAGDVTLEGNLFVPDEAQGIVVFAHGSGSSRFSPRNRFVASVLQGGGLATLLFDLLTSEEEEVDLKTREYRFDIPRLSRRVVEAIDWLAKRDDTTHLACGAFGSSTGAAAALIAAAERPGRINAVVSRGGRPDLAGDALQHVRAPTLLIVGGRDKPVISMNRDAMDQLTAPVALELVPGATHLFEEEGALEQVAELARDWFVDHLSRAQHEPAPSRT